MTQKELIEFNLRQFWPLRNGGYKEAIRKCVWRLRNKVAYYNNDWSE